MNRVHCLLVAVGLAAVASAAQAQVSYTGGTYTQDFDSLPSTGTPTWTNNSTLPGWFAFRIANSTPGTVRAASTATITAVPTLLVSDGSSNSGGIYSFGNTGSTNRALGSIGSGTPQDQSFCVVLRNDTTTTFNAADIAFIGEQWRNGGNATQQNVIFDYAVLDGASDLGNAGPLPGNQVSGSSFISYGTDARFDLLSVINTATASRLDGTLAANQITPAQSGQISGLSWAPGQYFMVRWYDTNSPGNDHGMAIDNLTITPRLLIRPNITTTVVDSPDPVQLVGSNLTYTITPFNGASAATSAATVSFTLPANVQFVSSSVTFTQVGQTYTLNAGAIAANSAGTPITLVVAPQAEFPAASPLTVAFTGNPGGNVTTAQTTVVNSADLGVTVANDANCVTTIGQSINYTVGVTNNGPANATAAVVTVNLSPNTTYVSSSPSAGSVAVSGSTLTWTVGNLIAGASPTLSIASTVSAEGGQLLRATASSATADAVSSNNTATTQTTTTSTAAALQAQLSSVTGAPTNGIPIDLGGFSTTAFLGTASGGSAANSFAIARPFSSPNGQRFVFSGETTFADASNSVLVAFDGTNYSTVAQEGVTVLDAADPANNTVWSGTATFDRIQSINDSGQVLFSTRTSATGNPRVLVIATPAVAPATGYTYNIIARQGDNATVLGNTGAGNPIKFGATISAAKGGMLNDGTAAFTFISDTGIRAAVKNNGATLVSRTASATYRPDGQANGTTANISTWRDNTDQDANTRGFSVATDVNNWLLEATLTNGTGITGTQDEVLILNTNAAPKTIVLQEGYTVPGSTLTQTVGGYTHSEVGSDGNWISLGGFNPVPPASRSDDFVILNGNVLAVTGQPIITGSTETWSDAVFASTFFLATNRGTDTVIGGLTSKADATTDSVLVHNGTTVLLREGQPINVGTADSPSILFAGPILRNHRSFIDGSRNLWTVIDVRTESWPCNATGAVSGLALVKIPLPGGTGPTCLADLNVDGVVDGSDFVAFINSFAIGDVGVDAVADVNLDGVIDGNDFVAFINAFALGC